MNYEVTLGKRAGSKHTMFEWGDVNTVDISSNLFYEDFYRDLSLHSKLTLIHLAMKKGATPLKRTFKIESSSTAKTVKMGKKAFEKSLNELNDKGIIKIKELGNDE